MAELVLIKAIVGSRAATVLCPNCGRISRQILSKSYAESTKAELLREYECPLCKSTYRECNSALVNNWTSAVLRYNRDADAYNQSVRENYWLKQNSKPKTTSNSTTMTTPKPAVPTERTGIQSLISVLEQHTDQVNTSLPVEKPAAANGNASKIKPLPMLTAYKMKGFDIKDFPNSYNQHKNQLTLPMNTVITDEEADYVIKCFIDILNEMG